MKIKYAALEGAPSLIIYPGNGQVRCYEYIAGAWREVNGADIVTKAGLMPRELFEEIYPAIGLPEVSL